VGLDDLLDLVARIENDIAVGVENGE